LDTESSIQTDECGLGLEIVSFRIFFRFLMFYEQLTDSEIILFFSENSDRLCGVNKEASSKVLLSL
jgi:hypothetical protein